MQYSLDFHGIVVDVEQHTPIANPEPMRGRHIHESPYIVPYRAGIGGVRLTRLTIRSRSPSGTASNSFFARGV